MLARGTLPTSYKRFFLFVSVLICFYVFQLRSYRDFNRDRDYIPHRSSSWCPTTPPPTAYQPKKRGNSSSWRNVFREHQQQTPISLPRSEIESKPLPRIQHRFGRESRKKRSTREARRAAVRTTFLRSWRSYKEKAWMRDELSPISGGSRNTFGGWAATMVDSLDTLWIMNLKDDFYASLDFVLDLEFGPEHAPNTTFNLFETTIRHLGGLISAYDLAGCKNKRILDKIIDLGDMMLASFATESHMPVPRWNPQTAVDGIAQEPPYNGVLSEIGSYTLEFTRLSQLTGDMRWFDAVQRITNALNEQQNSTRIPGLWPVGIDFKTPDFRAGSQFSLGAMADSTYEYLPKTYALLHGTSAAAQYEHMYRLASDMAIQHLLFRPMVPSNNDILMVGITTVRTEDEKSLDPAGQHLTCFAGGMLALGGRLFNNKTQVEIGRKVTDGCIWAYKACPLGIMPEWFRMIACPEDEAECTWDTAKWNQTTNDMNNPKGFIDISDKRYILRPEAIESVFYLYRITGDYRLQDIAWDMFTSIEAHTKTEFGNAALKSVLTGEKEDSMESFWMAETLKYFYLIFSEPDLISLDEFVFNTEAHPFRLPTVAHSR